MDLDSGLYCQTVKFLTVTFARTELIPNFQTKHIAAEWASELGRSDPFTPTEYFSACQKDILPSGSNTIKSISRWLLWSHGTMLCFFSQSPEICNNFDNLLIILVICQNVIPRFQLFNYKNFQVLFVFLSICRFKNITVGFKNLHYIHRKCINKY